LAAEPEMQAPVFAAQLAAAPPADLFGERANWLQERSTPSAGAVTRNTGRKKAAEAKLRADTVCV
jgi:hypothetical protein